MRINIKSILTVGFATLLCACTDLDERLYDQVGMDDYGQTDSEIATIVGGAYASLRGYDTPEGLACWVGSEFVFFLDETVSDEACIPTRGPDWYDGGVYQDIQRHIFKPDNKLFESYWKYCYNGITRVNSIIYQVDKSGLTDDAKNNVKAELRGLRAYYYSLLLDRFGAVPISTNFEDEGLPAKSSRADVFKFVETELLDVVDLLNPNPIYGRFTQAVAYGVLARIYLNAEVYINTARWDDCVKYCDKVRGYMLEPSYFTNFARDNEKSQEIMLAATFDHTMGTTGNYLASMTYNNDQKYAFDPAGIWQWSANGISAQPGLYSSFEEKDVRRSSLLIGEQINLSTGSVIVTDKGDQLIYTEDIRSIDDAGLVEGARLHKYAVHADDKWERDYDWVLMRYAEIIMMNAEANFRLGNEAVALSLVNQLRARAGLDALSSLTLEALDEEWRHEFVFEGLRRTVNIRFGTFFKPWWEKETVTEEYKKVFPIPANVLTLNPKLEQNPDYQ